jgi:hypothetical protein
MLNLIWDWFIKQTTIDHVSMGVNIKTNECNHHRIVCLLNHVNIYRSALSENICFVFIMLFLKKLFEEF